MVQYIDKSALVAEIERRFLEDYNTDDVEMDEVAQGVLASLKYFIDTLEVKEANEALRTEYEKGRADVIADTLSWLANVWPQYCSNPTIIDAYKKGVVKD